MKPKAGDWILTLGLVLVALLPRLYVAIALAREPVWDGHYYHFGATRIADGLGYSEDVHIGAALVWKPWCHYPVGYSAFLGLLYQLFGDGLLVGPVANACAGACIAGFVHRIALGWLGPLRAAVAGGLCALHPGLILYTPLLMTETLSALPVVAAVWIALTWPRPPARIWTAGVWGAGVALGLGALVRPPWLLAVPLLGLPGAGGWRHLVTRVALIGCVTLGVVAPWTVRNCRVMDGCALISTNGGWNLAIGALTDTGRFVALTANDGCPVVSGQVQQDRCWAEVGLKRILDDPWAWLGRAPKKLMHTFNHESFAVSYMAEADPARWPEERKRAWWGRLTVFHHALMLAALLSVFSLPRPTWPPARSTWLQVCLLAAVAGYVHWALDAPEPPLYWLIVAAPLLAMLRLPGAPPIGHTGVILWGLVVATILTHVIFFGDDRYHIPLSPILCILAAGALRPSAALSPLRPIGPVRPSD